MSVRAFVNKGFTLVETIVAMVIISIAALAMASSLGVAFSHSSDSLLNTKFLQLGHAYLEEIQSRRFDERSGLTGLPPCTPAGTNCGAVGPEGETRRRFDDVDDYDGLVESPPLDANGDPRTEFPGFSVQVDVAYATATQMTAWQLDDSTDAKIVTVTVIAPDGKSRTFQQIRGNF